MALGMQEQQRRKQMYGSAVDLERSLGVPEWVMDAVFVTAILSWYFTAQLFLKTENQRAYIISTLNCVVSIVVGLHTCNDVVHWSMAVDQRSLTETPITRLTVRFFRMVQILDVAVGLAYYPTQLFLLTTWIHHTCYTLLCSWMLNRNVSVLFSICLLEELPTLIMALGRLHKGLRSDLWFGITYGILRVGMHTLLVYNTVTYSGTDDRIYVIQFNFALTWCLHVNWFVAWMRQQARIRSETSIKETKQ